MRISRPVMSISTFEQPPIQRAGLTITPQSEILELTWPGGRWRWVRPQALLIQDCDTLKRVTVPDRTRALCLACLCVSVLGLGLALVSGYAGSTAREE